MTVPRNTYGGTRAAWLALRYGALVRAFARDGAPPWLAARLAGVVLALWRERTGDGRGERDFNPGGDPGAVYDSPDAAADAAVRRFPWGSLALVLALGETEPAAVAPAVARWYADADPERADGALRRWRAAEAL